MSRPYFFIKTVSYEPFSHLSLSPNKALQVGTQPTPLKKTPRVVGCIHLNHLGKRDMANRSVISVHTKPETSKRLEELASLTRRSKSFLANEAIERYLSEEEAFINSVRQGMADVAEGRVYEKDEVRARLNEFVAERSASKSDS